MYRKLRSAGDRRQQRLLACFAPQEVEQLWTLLRRVEQQIARMNAGR